MAIVTGDRYLEHLVRFVDRNTGPLLDGALTLKLNPVGLQYVQTRLEALRELEGLLAGAPVDYLRAYVSDLGDHRALEHLRRILRLLTSLKVISVLPPPARDPTPLSLLPFARLRVLELRGCDLSTSAARGLLELRHTLEKFICHNSTDALRHVFASRIADIKESPVWNRLSFVSCACNGLVLMDESLQLLPFVETLDLSRNSFAKVDNLQNCTKLKHLDLGFNHLRTIASLSEVSCPIVKLVLRNNALTSLCGLENLKLVEGLDLSYNIISSFSELEILASLSCLQSLWLEGNPICCARWYRAHVFSFFSHPEKLKLDEKGISTREYWERHIIFAKRQKQPAGYGFYFPAKDVEDEDSINIKRKKHSRLASIEDDEHRRHLCSDVVDQESVSGDSNSSRKDENAISDGDSEIVGLMNKVEYMKKERSALWLREFKEWLDQTSGDTVNGSQCIDFNSNPVKEKYLKQRKGRKHLGESSNFVPDTDQVSEGASSSNILESDMSFPDTYIDVHGNDYIDTNGRGILECPVLNGGHIPITDLKTRGANSVQDQLDVHSRVPHKPSSSEANGHSNHSSLMVEGSDQIEQKISLAPTAIEEIMGSRSSSICPGSPPHYQQDILHRRLYLEEELLQLSAESLSMVSSDSDTSCSEDDLCRFHASVPELDPSLNHGSTEQGVSDHLDALFCEDNHQGGHENSYLEENISHSSDYCAVSDSGTKKYLLPNRDKPLPTGNILDDIGCCEIDQVVSKAVCGTVKRKGNRKPMRRVASLMENSLVCNTEVEFQNSNGTLDIGKDDMDTQGKASCKENYIHDSCEQAEIPSCNYEVRNSATSNDACSSHMWTKPSSLNLELDDVIKDFFHLEVADSKASETCQEVVRCGCIFQLASGIQESEVALLRSCKNKLYMLLIGAEPDGQGTVFKVLGCHRPQDVREVVIGLGLQALRVHMEEDSTYLFLPRTVEKSKDLLSLIGVCDSTALNCECSLQSWEQVQVKLLEKYIYGSLKMGIFLYSMLLFWHDRCEGESWLSRSLFVVERYVLVCVEDLVQFGSSTDDLGSSSPYYSLVSCCPIHYILKMVIELDDRCLTLSVDHVYLTDMIEKKMQPKDKNKGVVTWKLKWFSEDTLLKFVAVVNAIYSGLTSSPLPVKCIS